MSRLTIRNLDSALLSRLRMQAAVHNRSVQEEASAIIGCALADRDYKARSLGDAIRKRFQPFGGLNLEIPSRTSSANADCRTAKETESIGLK